MYIFSSVFVVIILQLWNAFRSLTRSQSILIAISIHSRCNCVACSREWVSYMRRWCMFDIDLTYQCSWVCTRTFNVTLRDLAHDDDDGAHSKINSKTVNVLLLNAKSAVSSTRSQFAKIFVNDLNVSISIYGSSWSWGRKVVKFCSLFNQIKLSWKKMLSSIRFSWLGLAFKKKTNTSKLNARVVVELFFFYFSLFRFFHIEESPWFRNL